MSDPTTIMDRAIDGVLAVIGRALQDFEPDEVSLEKLKAEFETMRQTADGIAAFEQAYGKQTLARMVKNYARAAEGH